MQLRRRLLVSISLVLLVSLLAGAVLSYWTANRKIDLEMSSSLAVGDLLLLFTDGLLEVYDANQELYTQAQLIEAVRQRLTIPTPQLFDEVLDELRAFRQEGAFDDDVCVVGVELTRPVPVKTG